MPVELIVDCFGVDEAAAIVVDTSDASIDAARHAVYQHLHTTDDTLLRLRLNNPALVKHFREFEGMLGFTMHRLIPRLLLAEWFKTPLPAWLTDECIVELGLLQKSKVEALHCNASTFEEQLLNSCHIDLLNSSDFHAFVVSLNQQAAIFLSLLKEESIKRSVCQHLHHDLNINKEAAALFISQLLLSSNISHFLRHLAYQQYLHHLRRVVIDYQLTVALPALALPTNLLTALPLLSLAEEQAQQLPELSLSVLKAISQKIVAKSVHPEVLATVLVMDWDSVLAELAHLTEEHHALISADLVKQLRTLHSAAAQTQAEKFNCYLTASYPPLSATASVNEALVWSEGYFDYLRPVLLNKQIPDESINGSFTAWLLSQSARIARSNADWRYCAKQIEKFLAQNYLVVVVMVDALSALNQDILLAQLASFEQLISTDEMLFAPLPTLTEIGKMAVLTGKHSHLLPSDSETALKQIYSAYLPNANALKVIKSWEDVNQHIEAHTNLVVFFENRIDERLHDCVNFDKHRSDISPIVRQLKASMQRWLKDAGQRDVVFFITADHGMTVTQGSYDGQLIGEVKDRTMKIQHGDSVADDFVLMQQDSKDSYAIVKTRSALTHNTALAHGGLTPEEVLIPFITLATRPPLLNKMPLDVDIIGNCTRLGNKYWQLELRLTATEQVETIKLSLDTPFSLEKRPPIDIIRAEKSVDIILKFAADCEQDGLIALDIQLHYDRASVPEKNTHRLEINFPPPLLERDAGTQSFEDMF